MHKNKSIGKLVHILRVNRFKAKLPKMNQQEVSSSLGMSQGTLSKIENELLDMGSAELLNFLSHINMDANTFTELLTLSYTVDAKEMVRIVDLYYKVSSKEFKRLYNLYLECPNDFPAIIDQYIFETLDRQKKSQSPKQASLLKA